MLGAPSAFCAAIAGVLAGLEGVISYVDDMILKTNYDPTLTTEEAEDRHLEQIKNLFKRLQLQGLKLNLKVEWFRTSLTVLGRKCNQHGMQINDKHLKMLREFRRPETVKQLQAFLGIIVCISKIRTFYITN